MSPIPNCLPTLVDKLLFITYFLICRNLSESLQCTCKVSICACYCFELPKRIGKWKCYSAFIRVCALMFSFSVTDYSVFLVL